MIIYKNQFCGRAPTVMYGERERKVRFSLKCVLESEVMEANKSQVSYQRKTRVTVALRLAILYH